MKLERQGETIAWEARGDPGAPCLVLLHNLLTDRTVWDGVAERLAPGLRLLLVDLRGHGESSARAPFDVAALAGDLLAILDAEGVATAEVAGVSLGAAVAVELARQAPARVRRLVLLAPNHHRSSWADALKNGALAASVRWLGWTHLVLSAAVGTLLSPGFRDREPAVARGLATRIARLDPAGAARAVRCWIARPALLTPPWKDPPPIQVVVGGEDLVAPPALGQELADALGSPTLVVLMARAGHTLPLEQPAEVARLLASRAAHLHTRDAPSTPRPDAAREQRRERPAEGPLNGEH